MCDLMPLDEYKRIMLEQERLLEDALAQPIQAAAAMTPRRPGAPPSAALEARHVQATRPLSGPPPHHHLGLIAPPLPCPQ
jgi:hypothetical protein